MLKNNIFAQIRKALKRNRQKRTCKRFLLELNELDSTDFLIGLSIAEKARRKVLEAELLDLRVQLGQKIYNSVYRDCLK